MKIYEVSDWQLAVSLKTLGYVLVDVDRTNLRRQVFQFRHSPEIEKDADEFFRDKLLLNPREVMTTARFLKERLRG